MSTMHRDCLIEFQIAIDNADVDATEGYYKCMRESVLYADRCHRENTMAYYHNIGEATDDYNDCVRAGY